ncbi:MAG TPA: ribosome biogenesis GTP-binding protein YihA/YsxC [Gemmatimonadota bacterium]|nr:ribosome biogenesis GTP-binding protein YihA/YsxC [Gemmatimonadota bacterium]
MTTASPRERPSPELPEIAFTGRSNVGKSSLLNALMRRKRLARTSRTPGRTRAIHYYQVGDRCYFVDLPGYGYAAVPEGVRRSWAPMIEGYLDSSERLAGVLSLVDGRREPTDSDRLMIDGLAARGLPTLVVLTKADKVPRARRSPGQDDAARRLGLDSDQVVWFSALTGEGRDEVLSAAEVLLDGVEA